MGPISLLPYFVSACCTKGSIGVCVYVCVCVRVHMSDEVGAGLLGGGVA